ncbi:MAG: sigma-70 family RNA polymerase sigma factor [Saprospiraceae bacterium]|nr:sigma-70 family RNA polymerase sigma factor [Saprospiraceae bacterium]
MTYSVTRFLKAEKNLLADKKGLYEALGRAEPGAIRALANKIAYDVRQATLRAGLAAEDAEELLNDAVVITINNIRNQAFQFAEFSPAAYANGVARKLIANRVRTKKPVQQDLEEVSLHSELNPEAYLNNKELEGIIGKLLHNLGENCQQLLRLKYFENMRDKEIIEQALTPYNSTTSLKSKRNQCLNKLIEIAMEAKVLEGY